MYDYGTDNFLRNEIANAERFRTELGVKLAGYRTNVDQTEAKIAALNTRITDLARLLDFHERYEAEQAAPDVDDATEAFVDVADAERYAQRDEYVNAERTTLAEQLRAHGAEQAAQDAEADAFHAQRRADEAEANGEYVDYAEAKSVREIEREIAIEAGDDDEDGEL